MQTYTYIYWGNTRDHHSYSFLLVYIAISVNYKVLWECPKHTDHLYTTVLICMCLHPALLMVICNIVKYGPGVSIGSWYIPYFLCHNLYDAHFLLQSCHAGWDLTSLTSKAKCSFTQDEEFVHYTGTYGKLLSYKLISNLIVRKIATYFNKTPSMPFRCILVLRLHGISVCVHYRLLPVLLSMWR